MGPSALRLAKLSTVLEELDHTLTDLGNVEVPVAEAVSRPDDLHFAEAIAQTCRQAYLRLRGLPRDTLPITLGGDHSIAMGTISGIARGSPLGVIWVDAHADLNTPATSPSGNIHGMPLSHLLGQGDPRMLGIWGGGAVLAPENIVFIGLRNLDPDERELIRAQGITTFTMKDIDRRGIAEVTLAALEQLAHLERLHLSFDADALDPDIAPGVGTPVPGGLSYREAHLLMELLADAGTVTSLDLVEVNPILDIRNRTAQIMVEMTASLLGKKIL